MMTLINIKNSDANDQKSLLIDLQKSPNLYGLLSMFKKLFEYVASLQLHSFTLFPSLIINAILNKVSAEL